MLVINNRPATDDLRFDGLFIGAFAPVEQECCATYRKMRHSPLNHFQLVLRGVKSSGVDRANQRSDG